MQSPTINQRLTIAVTSRVTLQILSFAYITSFHYAYCTFINPSFEYAKYYYLPFSNDALLITYCLAWFPVIFYQYSSNSAQLIVALIYAFSYVPIQLSILFQVNWPYEDLVWIQFLLCLSMIFLFIVAKGKKYIQNDIAVRFWDMDKYVVLIVLVATAVTVSTNIGHISFTSFENVYDLRSAAAESKSRTFFSDYLTTWLIYCFISYLFARGIVYRKFNLMLLGLVSSALVYMCEGHKSAILLLLFSLLLNFLWGSSGEDFLAKLLLSLSSFVSLICFLPNEWIGLWVKSILLVRVLGNSGWQFSKYLDLFTSDKLTYFSQIKIVNFFTQSYPFGSLELGQAVSYFTDGNILTNYNASFWMTEGLASLGPLGIVISTLLMAFFLVTVNRVTANINRNFVVIWMAGLYISLINLPLFTSMVSGGGFIILVQAFLISKSAKQNKI